MTGVGLMEGKQKLFYLPEPHTDFIFSVMGEELGLVGCAGCRALFAVFLWRGMRTALRTQDMFGRLLAVGITSMIVVQAFINISVVLGLMPTKGIPLPFISYGGSSLFIAGLRGRAAEYQQQAERIPEYPDQRKGRFPGAHWRAARSLRIRFIAHHESHSGGRRHGRSRHPCDRHCPGTASRYAAEMLFIGTARGIENRLVPAAGFPLQAGESWRTESREPGDPAENMLSICRAPSSAAANARSSFSLTS